MNNNKKTRKLVLFARQKVLEAVKRIFQLTIIIMNLAREEKKKFLNVFLQTKKKLSHTLVSCEILPVESHEAARGRVWKLFSVAISSSSFECL
jgi:hypothetical protein